MATSLLVAFAWACHPDQPQTSSQLAAALWGPTSGYDKDTRPAVGMAVRRGDYTPQPPETIFVQLQPFAITKVDPVAGEFTAEFWERTIWWDHRLQYNTTCFKPKAASGAHSANKKAARSSFKAPWRSHDLLSAHPSG